MKTITSNLIMQNMELAKIAYEAYCAARSWKSVKGETLPHFHQQDPALQDAWASVAAAVKNTLFKDQPQPDLASLPD